VQKSERLPNVLLKATVCTQLTLLVCVVAVAVAGPVTITKLALALVAGIPLLLTIPGLLTGHRRTLQILAVILVLYIGAAVVEVVAAQGGWLLSGWLASACVELGLVLAIVGRLYPRASRGSTESSNAAER